MESPWQQAVRVCAEADKVEALARLYMERNIGRPGTITWDEAMALAVETYRAARAPEVRQP